MAKRKYSQPICDICGKFMSWDDCANAVVYTPFGSSRDTEPPDEKLIHAKCWNKLSPREREIINDIAWIKPCCRSCYGLDSV